MEKKQKMKKCVRCGDLLPVRMFNRDSDSKTGLQSWCRRCTKLYFSLQREYRDVGGVRVCTKCSRILPKTMFLAGDKACMICNGEMLKSTLFSIDNLDDQVIFDALRARGWKGTLEKITKKETEL
jgi:hypothetical protein